MVPLYRYWNPTTIDHFYTTNFRELGRGRFGYRYEGIQGYVSPRRLRGTVPLYRYWNPTIRDHFYTTNFRELGRGRAGWRYEGIQCYVNPRVVTYAPTVEGTSAHGLAPEMGFDEEVESNEALGSSELDYSADEMSYGEDLGDTEGFQNMLQRMGIMGADQYDPSMQPGSLETGYPDAGFDDALETDLGAEIEQHSAGELIEAGADMFEPEALEPGALDLTPAQAMADSFTVEPTGEADAEHLMPADSFTTTAEHEGPAPQDSFSTSQQTDDKGNIVINLNLGKK
jgi:hypothetical protein